MSPQNRLLYQWFRTKHSYSSQAGFTLIEMLVVTLLSGIVVSVLLWGVVELLRNDRRESALSKTQQEMQLALDYITQDLRQAVYIYDGSCNTVDTNSCPSYIDYIPNSLDPTDNSNAISVLAFWKSVPLTDEDFDMDGDEAYEGDGASGDAGDACDQLSLNTAKAAECEVLKKQRNVYSLVVYTQFTDDSATWSGRSYIRRYELQKYDKIGSTTASERLTRNAGFVDPSEVSGIFPTWPYSGTTNCQADFSACNLTGTNVAEGAMATTGATSYATLVDFVDCPSNGSTATDCNTYTLPDIADADTATSGTQPCPSGYVQTPTDPAQTDTNNVTNLLSRSFFACVRSSSATAGEDFAGNNQDVIVYLRGNARSIGTAPETRLSSDEFTPLLQTQVTMRGVIDFTPN